VESSHPKISVVIPLYNKRDRIHRALKSVLDQDVTEMELIVVDDGSTDGGCDVVRAVSDPRVRLVQQTNAGVSAARNRGVSEAVSDLVAFLDADDEWLPGFATTIVALATKYTRCAFFATAYWRAYPGCSPLMIRLRELPFTGSDGVIDDYFTVAAVSDPLVCSSAVAVRSSALARVGGFPEGVSPGEDLLTWARLALVSPLAYSREPLAVFYAPGNVSDRPVRRPQFPDEVSAGLAELMSSARPDLRRSLRKYLALWHRMRAVVFLQLNETGMTRYELSYASRHGAAPWSLLPYTFIAWLPATLPARVYRKARALRQLLQKTSA
jgi:glycosyltransferase involved in cell wall biosynthesis